jgi:hypothetical protein
MARGKAREYFVLTFARRLAFLVGAAIVSTTLGPAWAEVRIQGPIENVRLEAHNATLQEILDALRSHFAVSYRGVGSAEQVTGVFQGPLRHILPRLLDANDFMIETTRDAKIIITIISPDVDADVGRASPPVPAPLVHRREDKTP